MTRKTIYLLLIIFVLTAIDVCLVLKVLALKDESRQADVTQLEFLNENYNGLFKKEALEIVDQNQVIPNYLQLTTEKGEIKPFSSITPSANKYRLVIRLSQENCFTCYQQAFKIINTYKGDLDAAEVAYLGRYTDLTTMRTFVEANFGKVFPLNLEVPLNLAVEDLKQPYLFVLDEDNRVNNVFVINKQKQKQIDEYLSVIVKRYFNPKGVRRSSRSINENQIVVQGEQ